MLKLALTISTVAIMSAGPLHSQSFEWSDVGGELNLSVVSSTSGGDRFGQMGFAIDQVGLEMELRTSINIVRQAYPDLSQDFFTTDADGKRISVKPTVSNVWSLLSKDKNILGVVPIGYSEVAGSPEVAGYHKIDGVSYNSLFSAPNMDTIFCLDDLDRKYATDQNFSVPFLLEANVGPRYTYTYEEDRIPAKLNYLDVEDRWKNTFDACENMIQTGFRLIEPLHILIQNGATSRTIQKLPADVSLGTFPLTAIMFDRNARFNFVRFGNINPISAAEVLSSMQFQQSECSRSVRGAEHCEIWATMLTAFDDAAMIVRAGPNFEHSVFGNKEVIAPAVLVLSKRRPYPDTDEAEAKSTAKTK
ncbi:hypothetical protein J4E08_22730 [Sagittula sp. NFXS13]|uniref:hypothetical protein n=1 Tax=Sagittula sp. NFXS13 TaxID=2819095 RepID=UPI0032DEF13F